MVIIWLEYKIIQVMWNMGIYIYLFVYLYNNRVSNVKLSMRITML